MALGSRSKAVVKDIVIVAVGVLAIWIGLTTVFGTQNPFYVVSSGSMIPELQIYDIIVVQGNDPFGEVEVGDIVVFNRPAGHDRVIVHRVVAITDDDPFTVRTQGDANPASIPGTDFPITAEEYIGTVAYVIPQVGFVTRVFATQVGGIPLNYIIIAVIIGVMVAKQVMGRKGDGGGVDEKDGKGSAADRLPTADGGAAGGSRPESEPAGGGGGHDVPRNDPRGAEDPAGSGEEKAGAKGGSEEPEGGHVRRDADAGTGSEEPEGGHVRRDADAGTGSEEPEGGHVRRDADAGTGSEEPEGGHVRRDADAGTGSEEPEGGHVRRDADAGT